MKKLDQVERCRKSLLTNACSHLSLWLECILTRTPQQSHAKPIPVCPLKVDQNRSKQIEIYRNIKSKRCRECPSASESFSTFFKLVLKPWFLPWYALIIKDSGMRKDSLKHLNVAQNGDPNQLLTKVVLTDFVTCRYIVGCIHSIWKITIFEPPFGNILKLCICGRPEWLPHITQLVMPMWEVST